MIQRTYKQKLRHYLLWLLWIVIVQLMLANISASIYAYKFTHFYTNPPPYQLTKNILIKTWKLFVGPRFYKLGEDSTTPPGYEKIILHTDNNLSIESWYGKADSATRCVIFLHGVTANKAVLLREAEQFKKWGYNTLLIDFRAHGNSEGKKTSFGVKETDEVQKAFAFARKRGNKIILLYGSSMGSVVIMKAIAEKKVNPSAIIVDMPFGSLQDHLKGRARSLGFPAQPFAFLVTLWIGIENGYNGFNHKTYDYAKKITCPVLLEWGTNDMYITQEETNGIYKSLSSYNKKLIVYPNADHQSFLQFDPVHWEKEMNSFLNSLRN